MNYTFHQLQVFLKICETQSVTKASDELSLTQPAISIQLKKFQDQFKIPLTELVGRRILITDFGTEIAKVCKKIISESLEIENMAARYQGLLAGKLSFSIVSTGKYILPYFLSDFMEQHKGIEISIDVTNKTKVVESLVKNETDFSLVSVLPDDLELEVIELMENELFLVGGKHTETTTINKKELENLPFIFREEGSATRLAMEGYFKKLKIKPSSRLVLVSNEAVKQSVCAGLGYSIMPLIGMKDELERGNLHIIPAEDLPIKTTWRLVYNKNKNLSPVAKAFVEHLTLFRQKVVNEYFN